MKNQFIPEISKEKNKKQTAAIRTGNLTIKNGVLQKCYENGDDNGRIFIEPFLCNFISKKNR